MASSATPLAADDPWRAGCAQTNLVAHCRDRPPDPGAAWAADVRLERVAAGFHNAVFVTTPAHDARLFVAEQGGKIRIVRGGKILPKAFLNISAKVGRKSAEQRLLGLAFHPKYATNGLFYVNYTDLTGATVIAEYRRSSQRDRALPDSERIIIRIERTALNHNGDMVAFGPDRYLYTGHGRQRRRRCSHARSSPTACR